MDTHFNPDRYERERDDLEPDDEEIPSPPPLDMHSRRGGGGGGHHERYPGSSLRMLSSRHRERRHPQKYSVSDFDEEYIPKRHKYIRREDEEEDLHPPPPRHHHSSYSRHRHEEDEYQEPITLPRSYRRSSVPRAHTVFEDQEIEGPSYKAPRSVRSHRMRPSYQSFDDEGLSASDLDEHQHGRSASSYRHRDDQFERSPTSNEGFGFSRSYYKKYVPKDDYEQQPVQQFKRKPVIFEEPHESYASFLQGMYGPNSFGQSKAASLRNSKSLPSASWPGITMDNIPILDPKPEFDKSFMENFLASNNKHFSNSDSGSSSSSMESLESSNEVNQAYDDNDNENEESQHHNHHKSRQPSSPPTSAPGRLKSLRSFMPFNRFGFGNFFGGSIPASSSKNRPSRHHLSDDASRVTNLDDAFDEDEDMSNSESSHSNHDSCDGHDSSDSMKNVKFASPEIEIIQTAKSTSLPPLTTSDSSSMAAFSQNELTTTKSPVSVPTFQNITDVSNNAM